MLVVRNWKQDKFKFDVDPNRRILTIGVINVIEKFSKGVLRKIFEGGFHRDRHPLLEVNAIYIDYVNNANETTWNFAFIIEEGEGGIILAKSETWLPNTDFYDYVVECELNKGEVIYAFAIESDKISAVNQAMIDKLVEQYFKFD